MDARDDVWLEAEVVHSLRIVELCAMHELRVRHVVSGLVRLS